MIVSPEYLSRIKTAAEFVRDGMALPVGDVLLHCEDDETLCVTGWSRAPTIEAMTRQSALNELSEIIEIFNRMREAYPPLIEVTGKHHVKICLGFDYGMGAIRVCSIKDGNVSWEVAMKP